MSISKVFLVFSLISLSIASYREATTGYVAPLIHITSPEHPLYNPNKTRTDLVNDAIRVSNERLNHFAQQSIGSYAQGVAPITYEMVMKYYIGTPPKVTYAVPDTGSHINWLQCQPCKECYPQEAPVFNPNKSSTYKTVPCSYKYCKEIFGFQCPSKENTCRYRINYADNSYSTGVVSKDTITLPGDRYGSIPKVQIPNIVFGCGFENKGVGGDVGGVIGLTNVSISLPTQMRVAAFSYCVSDGGDGGLIRFGSEAILMGGKTSLFMDIFGRYQSVIVDIFVAGNRLNLPSDTFKMVPKSFFSGVTVDSGTPITRLTPVAYDKMVDVIREVMYRQTGHGPYGVPPYYNECYNALKDHTSIAELPTVHFLFDNNVLLRIPNENIWDEVDNDWAICLKIFKSPFNWTIIGTQQLISYNVGFDLLGQKLWLDYQEDCRS